MEQQTFDASNILSKLRQNRSSASPSTNADRSSASQFGRGSRHHSPAQRNRFQRKERPEVRIELENEVDHLTIEVARLKRENKQLGLEKEDLEYRCTDIKEKADLTISKLRNKLVALNKKFNEVSTSSTKDKYVAKKNLQKTFSKGAGVLNITNSLPSTVPMMDSASSVQNLTFSQFMKRNSQEGEAFNSSLRHYQQQQQQQQQQESEPYDHMNSATPPSYLQEEMAYASASQRGVLSHFDHVPLDSAEEENEHSNVHPHPHPLHPLKSTVGEGGGGSSSSSKSNPARSKSIAPPPRLVEDHSEDFTQFMDNSDVTMDNHLLSNTNNNNSNEYDDDDDDLLPVVDIDLRSA